MSSQDKLPFDPSFCDKKNDQIESVHTSQSEDYVKNGVIRIEPIVFSKEKMP